MYKAAGKTESVDIEDVNQVCSYIDALNYARRQMRSKNGLPLSMRLMNGAHRRLMKNVSGHNKARRYHPLMERRYE